MKFNLLSSADLESESQESKKETRQTGKSDKNKNQTHKKKQKEKSPKTVKKTKDTNHKQEKEEKKERKKKRKSSDKKEERKEKRQQKQKKKTSKSESNRVTSNRRESRSEKKIQPARAKTQNRPDSGSDVLEINLIKNEISVFFDWYKNIALLIIFVFITLVFLGELYWWQSQRQERIVYSQDAILEVTKDIRVKQREAREASVFKEKLGKTTYLLDHHIYWTKLFEMLEETRVKGVVFTGFQGDIKGEYTIPAKTYNYLNIGKQVNALKQNEYVEEVKVSQASSLKNKEINQIEFRLDIEVSPKIFKE